MMRNMEGMGPTGRRIDISQLIKKKEVSSVTQPEHIERYSAKETYEKIKKLMETVSNEQNQELRENFGAATDLIKKDGSISFESFSIAEGGRYSEQKIKADEQFIAERMREWSGVEEPKTRDHRLDEYRIDKNLSNAEQDELIIERFKEGKVKTESAKLEAAVSIIFHKILKSKFLVVRSAEPDDFKEGVDNVMINKETGEIICTFDEVSEPENGIRIQKKIKDTNRKNATSGSSVEYGLTFKKDEQGKTKVMQTRLDHIPSFFLAVAPDELKNLLMNMEFDPSKPPSPIELQMFDKFIDALKKQAEAAIRGGTRGPTQENISKFLKSVGQIQELRNQFV